MHTKNTQPNIIDVAKALSPILSARDVVDQLQRDIDHVKPRSVILDFAFVEFVSRSAAHALLKLKEKNDIQFVNANDQVSSIIRIVAANRAVPKTKVEFMPQHVDVDVLFREHAV